MFEGKADWSHIADLKRLLRIPVLGSGDLFTAANIVAMLDQTGCDGVMIARGALGNPWIFHETLKLLAGEESLPHSNKDRLVVALQHLDAFISHSGEKIALQEMRKHLCWYVKGVAGASRFRDFVNRAEGKDGLVEGITDFFLRQGIWTD
jgi:tRNA-dihydrouridine synthase